MTIEGVIAEMSSVVILAVLGSLGAVSVVVLAMYSLEFIKGLFRD